VSLLFRESLTPSGFVTGRITDDEGRPVKDVQVRVFGTSLCSYSDASGHYEIKGVPVAGPRHIVVALKDGYIEGQKGDIDVKEDETVNVDLTVIRETRVPRYLKDELKVIFCYIVGVTPAKPVSPPMDAVIDPSLYPEHIRPFLNPGKYIESDHPSIVKVANGILGTLPKGKRMNETAVAKAVYNWVVKNIRYDLIGKFPEDVTCGNWQTTYGGWGHSFADWCYTAREVLEQRRGICIEFARLTSALLRALNIPSRPAPLMAHPGTQWWAQRPDGSGFWCIMDTSVGNNFYDERGDLWSMFLAPYSESMIGELGYAVNEDAPIHMDWYTENPCLWYENYGENLFYDYSDEGLRRAKADMEYFQLKGQFPRKRHPRRGENLNLRTPVKRYKMQSRGFAINLANLGEQRTIVARFPLPFKSEYRETVAYAYWTNHPEWVKRTWTEEIRDDRTKENLSFYCVEFTLE